MDSADSIPESAWTILDTLTAVPIWMWAAGVVAGFFGILVLVFPFSHVSFIKDFLLLLTVHLREDTC